MSLGQKINQYWNGTIFYKWEKKWQQKIENAHKIEKEIILTELKTYDPKKVFKSIPKPVQIRVARWIAKELLALNGILIMIPIIVGFAFIGQYSESWLVNTIAILIAYGFYRLVVHIGSDEILALKTCKVRKVIRIIETLSSPS